MYFSDHNDDIVFVNGYDTLEAEGPEGGILCAEDLPGQSWGFKADEYSTLTISPGIVRVEAGFLMPFQKLNVLVLGPTVEEVELTAELKKLLRRRRVLIRGTFGSYAERLSRELGLRFRHSDIFLAENYDERHHESSTYTLYFENTGPYLLLDVKSPGWAASNLGGGVIRTDLPDNFYVGETPESFAEHFGESYREQIRQNAQLKAFLEEANRRRKK